jgi:hypothetical protein
MRDIDSMIEVLQAAKRGEKIEYTSIAHGWIPAAEPSWDFSSNAYRIAPKKEMSLVERLRVVGGVGDEAADRIEELEGFGKKSLYCYATDELLAEIARRVK